MFVLIPYHVDVPMRRVPWMNWGVIGLTVVFYPLCVSGGRLTPLGDDLVLGHGPDGWLGHLLVHADLSHLIGNMIFLWVFGNAVCAKVGNLAYPVVYVGLGLAAAAVTQLLDPRPSVGASGAINGVVGLFVVWYLRNEISCWYAFWFFGPAGAGSFSLSSYWMVLLWVAFDVWGVASGDAGVAYFAHLGGFAAGVALAVLLLKTGLAEMDRGEQSLLQVFGGGDGDDDDRHRTSRRGR